MRRTDSNATCNSLECGGLPPHSESYRRLSQQLRKDAPLSPVAATVAKTSPWACDGSWQSLPAELQHSRAPRSTQMVSVDGKDCAGVSSGAAAGARCASSFGAAGSWAQVFETVAA